MANPLPNESEIYQKIREKKLSIPGPISELLEHHILNNLNLIMLYVESYSQIDGGRKKPIPSEIGERILKRCAESVKFLKNLKTITS